MAFYENLISGLRRAVEEKYDGKPSRLAKVADTHPSTLARLMDGDRKKWLMLISRLADAAGLDIRSPYVEETDTSSKVCWVEPQVLGVSTEPPASEIYLAVPMVTSRAAESRGKEMWEGIEGWILVHKKSIAPSRWDHLLAIRIAGDSDSMEPTLKPGDIVLCDTNPDQFRFRQPGNIHVAREPDGSVSVKRVSIKQTSEDTQLIFYSDDVVNHPPLCFSLMQDYEGELCKAVLGRVIWTWSDMSYK